MGEVPGFEGDSSRKSFRRISLSAEAGPFRPTPRDYPMSAVLKDTEAALPTEYEWAWRIHERVGKWSKTSVRHALTRLCKAGKAERSSAYRNKTSSYVYRAKKP